MIGREGRAGFYQKARAARSSHSIRRRWSTARSSRPAAVARGGRAPIEAGRRPDPRAVRGARTTSALPARDAGPDARLRASKIAGGDRARARRHRSRRCAGASAGSSVRSRLVGCRLASSPTLLRLPASSFSRGVVSQERGREPRSTSATASSQRRVPLEDERDRRRHASQMLQAGVKEASQNFAALGRRQRRAELLRRREPDAAAARGAGRQLGRDRSDDPRVPGRDDGAALRGRAGGRRAGRADARRRRARSRCTAIACRRRRRPTSASSRSASG